MDLTPGMMFDDRYELVSLVEVIGLGPTWRARDPNIPQRAFTLKVLLPVDGEETPSALDAHLRALRRLRHKNVLPTTAHGVWEGHPYIVSGSLDGVALSHVLAHRRTDAPTQPLTEIEALFQQIAAGVGAAHGQSPPMVHGDLQPDVVVVSTADDGTATAQVLDFGLVPFLDPRCTLQRSGFIAPERRSQGRPEPAADVFSLGRILRAMLEAPGATDAASAHMDGFRGRPDAPEAVWEVLAKACALEPERRHPSVDALLRDLQVAWRTSARALEVSDPGVGPRDPAGRRRAVAPERSAAPSLLWGEASTRSSEHELGGDGAESPVVASIGSPLLRLPPLPTDWPSASGTVRALDAGEENPWATEVRLRDALFVAGDEAPPTEVMSSVASNVVPAVEAPTPEDVIGETALVSSASFGIHHEVSDREEELQTTTVHARHPGLPDLPDATIVGLRAMPARPWLPLLAVGLVGLLMLGGLLLALAR